MQCLTLSRASEGLEELDRCVHEANGAPGSWKVGLFHLGTPGATIVLLTWGPT